MNKEKNTQTVVIAILAVALLVMAVGYAGYTQNLQINGTAKAVASSWNIIWDKASIAQAGKTLTEASSAAVGENQYFVDSANTTITYNVKLEKPGTYYELSVNAINAGTIPANLKSITLSTPTTDKVTYKVTYAGTEYTASASDLTIPLAANGTAAVKVRIDYPMPASDSDLLKEDVTMTLNATFNYAQDETN